MKVKHNKQKPLLFKNYKLTTLLALIIAVLISALAGCPLKALTGLSCPGCGLTRAHVSAFGLDFKSAFYYHPLFWAIIPLAVFYLYKKPPFSKRHYIPLIVAALAFAAVFIIRLFVLKTDFLQPDLEESVIYKIINWFGGRFNGR